MDENLNNSPVDGAQGSATQGQPPFRWWHALRMVCTWLCIFILLALFCYVGLWLGELLR